MLLRLPGLLFFLKEIVELNMIRDFFHFMGAWKIWHSLFHDFVWTDWVLFSACIIAFVTGALKGFGFFFGKLVRSFILIFSVMLIYSPLAEWATKHLTFAPARFWKPFFFLLVTALVVFIIRKLSKLHSQKGLVSFHPFWDGVVGALSGFFFVILVTSFVVQFILFIPAKPIHKLFEKGGSRHGQLVQGFVPHLVDCALSPVRAIVNRKVPNS